MRRITFFIFLSAFLLLRPYLVQLRGLCGAVDDYGYFSHAAAIVYGQFPSYQKDYFSSDSHDKKTIGPMETIGPGIMATPFVLAFSLGDRILKSDIVLQRTKTNVPHSWSFFGFVIASIFYFWLGCLLLYRGLKYYVPPLHASWTVILMVICQGMPMYVFQAPVLSHVYEFFFQCCFIYLLLQWNQPGRTCVWSWQKLVLIGALSAFTFLTRYNNIFSAFMWPFVFLLSQLSDFRKAVFYKRLGIVAIVFVILVTLLKFIPNLLGQHEGYPKGVYDLFGIEPWSFYVRRFFHILFGIDWGLLYSAPFILVGLGALAILRFPLKRRLWMAVLPLAANFYIVMMWRCQGGAYGYRYFFPAMVPLLVYPLALLIQKLVKRFGPRAFGALCLMAMFPVVSMLFYCGNQTSLDFYGVMQYFDLEAYGNNTFQLESWEIILFSPVHGLFVLAQGGLLYLYYLLRVILQTTDTMPTFLYARYPEFKVWVLARVLMIYSAPFCFYGLLGMMKRLWSKKGE